MAARDQLLTKFLIAIVAALVGVGAVMIYSTTAMGQGPNVSKDFQFQMLYIMAGVALAITLGRLVSYRVILKNYIPIAVVAAALLILVLFLGKEVNHARRWFRFAGISFQPSEFAKVAVVIFFSGFLAARAARVGRFVRTFIPAILITGVFCLFILAEKDLGTTVLVGAVAWVLLFIAGTPVSHLLLPIGLGSLGAAAYIATHPYALTRVQIWFDPWKDPRGAGYHIIQSLIALGSGGIVGVGLGESTQKLKFLYAPSSDFIFSIIGEELGLVGCTVVIALFAAFIWVGVSIARRATDVGGRLLASGITAIVAIQALINIGVVTKALPTKGIPLPFISAGGSAAVIMLGSIGILYNIARTTAREKGPAPLEGESAETAAAKGAGGASCAGEVEK